MGKSIKKYQVILFAVFLLLELPSCAEISTGAPMGAQRVIKTSSPIYDALAALALDSGQLPFAVNGPMTAGELRRYLSAVTYESLSPIGRYSYGLIQQELTRTMLGFSAEGFVSLGIDPSIAVEGYVKSNAEIGWLYDAKDRNPLFTLPIFVSAGDYVTMETSLTVGIYEGAALRHNNFTNIPLNIDTLDGNFPHDAYASIGFQHNGYSFINFQIGQGRLNIGRTMMGSIILSDHMHDISYAKLSVFSPVVRFSSYITQHKVNKYFYFHQFEIHPVSWFSFSILEGVMVNAPLELRYLNPMMIFHGFGAWRDYDEYNMQTGNTSYKSGDSRVGSYLAFTLDILPFKYTRLYTLFAMNQFQLKYELKTEPDAFSVPNSFGFQGGIESIIPVRNGYVSVGGEFLYTTPWFYISSNKNWSLTSSHTEFYKEGGPLFSWIGTPFGPDTIAFQIGTSYTRSGDWNAGIWYRFKIHGENGELVFEKGNYYPSTPEQAHVSTPTGIPEYSHTVMLSGGKTVFPGVTISGGCGFSYYMNMNNKRGNTQAGVEATASVKIRPYEAYLKISGK